MNYTCQSAVSSKAVTKPETLVHLESKAKAPGVSGVGGGGEEKLLKNWSGFSTCNNCPAPLGGKKKSWFCPPEIGGYASMPKWMTGPFLISTKSSLVVLDFFFFLLSHTVRSSNFFQVSTFISRVKYLSPFSQERTQLYCPLFKKWLIKNTYLIILVFPRQEAEQKMTP